MENCKKTERGEGTDVQRMPVRIEDLLGREPIRPDMEEVFAHIAG